MVFATHIKVEETREVFEGLAIFNVRYDFRVEQKLRKPLKGASRECHRRLANRPNDNML